MPISWTSICWLSFLAITETEGAQRAKCIGDQSCKCDAFFARDWQWKFQKEMETCKHFLVDSGMENGRHKIFNYFMIIVDASTLNQKLDAVFANLKCAAKSNVLFGFVLRSANGGTCRYYYAHDNKTLMKPSKLEATIKTFSQARGRVNWHWCYRSRIKWRAKTKWNSYQLTNVTLFAALLRGAPMRCKNAVLPEQLTKNHTAFYLLYDKRRRKLYKTIYVSLKLSFCIWMQMGYLRKKVPKSSICSQRTL